MFGYLKYFAIASAVAIIVAAFALGIWFRHIAESDLIALAEKNNQALAQGFINTSWRKHHETIRRLTAAGIDEGQWKNYQEFVDFSQDAFHYFEEIPVAKLNVYTRKGKLILSTDQSQILMGGRSAIIDNSDFFKQALTGTITNRLVKDAGFRTPDGRLTSGTLVQTLVPMLSDTYVAVVAGSEQSKAEKVEGLVEVFYDVTSQWERLYLFQVIGTGGIILIFLILIGMLILIARKAEAIIAKQHEANVELAAQAAAAEAENRNKSQFLANISHELRTPLNSIIGFSEMIKNEMMGTVENKQYQDYIRDIHSSGVHLLSLINDILDFSKAEAGKLELDISEMDATKSIHNCVRLVSPRAEEAQVRLVVDLPPEHVVIKTDAKKFKQVLLNLLSNAVKFTPQGGEVKVTATKNPMSKALTIKVKDTGIGIAPKDIARALAPFGQVDSALSRRFEGTGLGLPLTRKFVELMGGQFELESVVNHGTTITITLPLAIERAATVRSDAHDPTRLHT